MVAADPTALGKDSRLEQRSNVFLAAVFSSTSSSAPAKIRNICATGALIEAAAIPPTGSEVRIVRGRLSTAGTIVWRDGNKSGIRFSSNVVVRDWMASATSSKQLCVDEVVSLVKAGGGPAPPLAAECPTSASERNAPDMLDQQVPLHLDTVRRLLECLGDDLATDMETVGRHGDALQLLDIAVQTLTELSQEARRSSSSNRTANARLSDLLSACEEALSHRV